MSFQFSETGVVRVCVYVCARMHALETEVCMRVRGVHERERVGHVCVYCDNVHSVCVCVCVCVCVRERERETHTYRKRERENN